MIYIMSQKFYLMSQNEQNYENIFEISLYIMWWLKWHEVNKHIFNVLQGLWKTSGSDLTWLIDWIPLKLLYQGKPLYVFFISLTNSIQFIISNTWITVKDSNKNINQLKCNRRGVKSYIFIGKQINKAMQMI